MANWAHLSIGTADERINLVGTKGAYWVHDWKPSAGPVEDYFSESALADGRQLASYRDLNATESFTLTVRASSQDQAIEATQDLRRMLRKARDYWASAHQPDPVYLAAQASCETNMRYAVIHAGAFPQDSFPFAGTFTRKNPAMTELPFALERGPWLENAPGTGTLISASAVEAFDGRNLGNVDSAGVRQATSAGVYVANKRNVANLTHIFTWSAANGFSANLMDAALPYDLIDEAGAAPQANDYVCFGIETGAGSVALTDTGPFYSLVFDIATAMTGIAGKWEYPHWLWAFSFIQWVGMDVADNTEQNGAGGGETWDTLGVRSIHWQALSSWDTMDINGVTAYWVRFRLTGTPPGAFTVPVQQNRDVYSIVWPYVDIAADRVGGDMPSLLRITAHNTSNAEPAQSAWMNPEDMGFDMLTAGLRSYDRGPDFTAYINLCDEQNPGGITATEGTDTTLVEYDETACGWCWQYAPAVDRDMCRAGTITLDSTIVGDFYGAFHAYLRVKQVGGSAGDISARLGLDHAVTISICFGSGLASYRYSEVAYTRTTNLWTLMDMGYITIPGSGVDDEVLDNFYIHVYLSNTNAPTADLFLSELILIPVDEWAIRVEEPPPTNTGTIAGVSYEEYLDVDGITVPKRIVRTPVKLVATDNIVYIYLSYPNNRPRLQHGLRQRLWFLTANSRTASAYRVSRCEAAQLVQLYRVQRYASARGSR